jgi:hypothetical protein
VLIAIQLIFLFKKKKYISLLEIKKSKAIFFFFCNGQKKSKKDGIFYRADQQNRPVYKNEKQN